MFLDLDAAILLMNAGMTINVPAAVRITPIAPECRRSVSVASTLENLIIVFGAISERYLEKAAALT